MQVNQRQRYRRSIRSATLSRTSHRTATLGAGTKDTGEATLKATSAAATPAG
jgi:hypothetical protein